MRVKYIGPNSVVVNGTHMIQGEVRDLNEKQANKLRGNPYFVVLDQVVKVEQPRDLPLQAIESPTETAPEPKPPAEPKPVKKSRSKRK